MSRNDSKITKVDTSWLASVVEEDHSLAGMEEYRILPRLKIIQAMSDKDLKKQFGEGSAIVRPGDAMVWKDGDEPFQFVPHLFQVEFCKWSDRRDSNGPMIPERSFDPTSEIAKRARDPKLRFEFYPDQEDRDPDKAMKYRYVEHLRFPGMIYGDHPLTGTPLVISFERGEFSQGKNFISAIKLRRTKVEDTVRSVPLWAQVWSFTVGFRERGDKRWYGLDHHVPDQSMILPEEVEEHRTLHMELKELHDKNRLMTEEDMEDDGGEPADSNEF